MSKKKERVTVTLDENLIRYINKVRYDNSFSATVNRILDLEQDRHFKRLFLSCFDEGDYVNIEKMKKLKEIIQEGDL